MITNPGAEYDATISAVVRIKTVRREGAGFGFDLMAANNQDLIFGYSDPSSTLNLRYHHNISDPTPDPSPCRGGEFRRSPLPYKGGEFRRSPLPYKGGEFRRSPLPSRGGAGGGVCN